MHVFILDVETTGFESPIVPLEVARLPVSGADPRRFTLGEPFHQFYNPGRAIEWGAVSAHHILPSDVADKPKWEGIEIPVGSILVGHNIDYDWEAIGAPEHVRRICTLALSRYLRPDMDAHRLGAMYYHIHGQIPEVRERVQRAHSALHDAGMAADILTWAATELKVKTWEEMYTASEEARIPLKMNFGKNKGVWIKDLNSHDPGYIRWALKNMRDMDPYLRKAFLRVGNAT